MCTQSYCIIKMMLWDANHVYWHLTDKEIKTWHKGKFDWHGVLL